MPISKPFVHQCRLQIHIPEYYPPPQKHNHKMKPCCSKKNLKYPRIHFKLSSSSLNYCFPPTTLRLRDGSHIDLGCMYSATDSA